MGALVRLLAPDTRTQVYHHDRCRIPLKQPVAMSTCQPVSLKHRPVMGTHATDVNGQVLLRLSTDNPKRIRSGRQIVFFFAQRPCIQTLCKKLRTGPCPHATYAVARSFQESE